MKEDILIRPAAAADHPAICSLLATENLPVSDIRPDMQHFFIAEKDGQPIGAIGLDPYISGALLRSMIVLPQHRNDGVAAALVKELEEYAGQLNINTLYLITNTAEKYFTRKGFRPITRELLPGDVGSSAEFNGLCPASSIVMIKHLS